MSLDRKIAVVTGGTAGLGLAIARELASNGATVIITSRKKSKLKIACRSDDMNFYGFQLDVSKNNSIIKFIENISEKFSIVDILVNNAGFPFERKVWFKKLHDVSDQELMKILQVDLIGSFRLTKEILKIMIKKRRGVIINIASTPAISGHICGSPYSVAKAGLISLTKHITGRPEEIAKSIVSLASGDFSFSTGTTYSY